MKLKSVMLIIAGVLTMTACNNDVKNDNAEHIDEMKEQNGTALFPKGEKCSNEWFSGDAYLHPLLGRDKNNEFSMGVVTFDPGARTHWHTHPKGQVLIITEGEGFYQEKGKPAQHIKKGDVVNIPENIEHWHGATAHTEMAHIAITNFLEEENVTWLDPVTDEEFDEVNR